MREEVEERLPNAPRCFEDTQRALSLINVETIRQSTFRGFVSALGLLPDAD